VPLYPANQGKLASQIQRRKRTINEEEMGGVLIKKVISQLLQRLILSVLNLDEYKQMFNRLRPLFTSLTPKRGLEIIFYAAVITTKLMTSLNGSVGPTVIIRGLTSVKGLEDVELLSTLITYLWRIDGVDYYGRIEPNEAKGFRHVRPERTGHEETGKSGSEWEKKLDSFWKGRLNGQDPLEVIAAKEKIDAAAIEVLDPYVIKIRNEKYGWKYGCGAKDCTKFFMLLNLCTNI
jgi:hypothetical protein